MNDFVAKLGLPAIICRRRACVVAICIKKGLPATALRPVTRPSRNRTESNRVTKLRAAKGTARTYFYQRKREKLYSSM